MSAVVKFSLAALGRKADKLGALKAEIAALEAKAKGLADEIIASGEPAVSGKLFKASVVPPGVRVGLVAELVKAKLSPADIIACSKSSPVAPFVKVSAL